MFKCFRVHNVSRHIKCINGSLKTNNKCIRNLCTQNDSSKNPVDLQESIKDNAPPKLSGFAESFDKFTSQLNEANTEREVPYTFASLLRNSEFMNLGDPEGKIVVGKVYHTTNHDLYIDFGWKFHCVCPKPRKNTESYVRGATVRLRVKQLELSSRFLGATKDLTLLEADCTLIGLISSPYKHVQTNQPKQE